MASEEGKSRSKTTSRIPQHRHCKICHKAIKWSETVLTCGSECQIKLTELKSKIRRNQMFLYVGLFVAVAVAFLALTGGLG